MINCGDCQLSNAITLSLNILQVYGSVVDHFEVRDDLHLALKANQDLTIYFQVLEKGIRNNLNEWIFAGCSLFSKKSLLSSSPINDLLDQILIFLGCWNKGRIWFRQDHDKEVRLSSLAVNISSKSQWIFCCTCWIQIIYENLTAWKCRGLQSEEIQRARNQRKIYLVIAKRSLRCLKGDGDGLVVNVEIQIYKSRWLLAKSQFLNNTSRYCQN